MYSKDRKVYLSYKDIKKAHNYAVEKINNLKYFGHKVHLVGIARGSFTILHELAVRCNVPYTILKYQSYDGNDTEIKMGFSSHNFPDSSDTIFIVDDIADSGDTINKTLGYLVYNFLHVEHPKLHIYTIVGSNKFKDWDYYYNHDAMNNSWVVFPYEI